MVKRNRRTGLAPYPSVEPNELALPVFMAAGLMDRTLVSNLLEREIKPVAARLQDHRRVELADIDWAVLVPAEGESVDGEVFVGLVEEDLKRLDAYRGVGEGLYCRAFGVARIERQDALLRVFIYLPTERTLRRLQDC